jgi:hypothetical protein
MTAAENKQQRAGRSVQQPDGYRAFIPAPLPPHPPVDLGEPFRGLLPQADYALGRLDKAMDQGLARLAQPPVSVRPIREIHAVLMEGVRGGKLTADLGGLQYELERLLDRPVDVVTERGLKARIRDRVLQEAVPL